MTIKSPHIERALSRADHDVMALLETAASDQDVLTFQALVSAITWSKQTPADLVKAIRLALSLEGPLIARKLAELGTTYHPAHPEIQKIARILAPPTVIPATQQPVPDVKANQAWIKAHREAYRRQWVALRNGELMATGQTFPDLLAKVGDIRGKGILVTQVT